jgi:hypothetical protein
LVYLQVVVWDFLASTLQPMTNPYVPKHKLSPFSQWLQAWLHHTNTAFDDLATYLAPLIHVKTTHPQSQARSSSGSTHRKATPCYHKHGAPPCNSKLALMASRLSPLVSPKSRRIATMLALQLPILQFLTQIPMISWWMGECDYTDLIQ